MQVINISDRNHTKRRNELLEVLDELRAQIESDKIEEFVITSMDTEGEVQIHACIKDVAGGVGMFEIGKNILIQQQC